MTGRTFDRICAVALILAALYMTLQLGRWWGQTECRAAFETEMRR